MKKSILNVALLGVLFVFGACSTADNDDNAVDNTAAAAEGLKDALTEVGDVAGFQKSSLSESETVDGVTHAREIGMYINSGNYKNISAYVINGTVDLAEESRSKVTYDNEVVSKSAEVGTLVITVDATFTLKDAAGTLISTEELAGYTDLYKLASTEINLWESVKAGGKGEWELQKSPGDIYYIVKKTTAELSMIQVNNKGSESTYELFTTTMAEAIAQADNYKQ